MSSRLASLLQAWRDAERRLEALPPDDPDRAFADAEVERARVAYHAVSDAVTLETDGQPTIAAPRAVESTLRRD